MNTKPDERIVATQRLWATRGMGIFWSALLVDLMVRIFILKQEFRQYADIALIWFGTVTYISLGMVANGVEPDVFDRSKTWLWVLMCAVELPVIFWLMGTVHTLVGYLAAALSSAVGSYLMLLINRRIHSNWERRTLGNGQREE